MFSWFVKLMLHGRHLCTKKQRCRPGLCLWRHLCCFCNFGGEEAHVVGGLSWGCEGLLPCSAHPLLLPFYSQHLPSSPSSLCLESHLLPASPADHSHPFITLFSPQTIIFQVLLTMSILFLSKIFVSLTFGFIQMLPSLSFMISHLHLFQRLTCLSFQFPISSTSFLCLHQNVSYVGIPKWCFIYISTISLLPLSILCPRSFCPLFIPRLAFLFSTFPTSFRSFLLLDLESSLFILIPLVILVILKSNMFRTELLIFYPKHGPLIVFIMSESVHSILLDPILGIILNYSHTPHLILQDFLLSFPSKYT